MARVRSFGLWQSEYLGGAINLFMSLLQNATFKPDLFCWELALLDDRYGIVQLGLMCRSYC